MKKQTIIIGGLTLSALLVFLMVQRKQNAHYSENSGNTSESKSLNQGGESHPGQSQNPTANSPAINSQKSNVSVSEIKKENNCFSFMYHHQSKNQDRDIEEFLNDTNAFAIDHQKVNQKSICVKVNNKPVGHKFVQKGGKTEVIIGSVVGPESIIHVSYCIGSAPCKESCIVKTKNKVDELLSDSEMGGLENAELETQVKELRNVASANGNLMDSTIIRDWNKEQNKEWLCENK
jgi:hypothetical protein